MRKLIVIGALIFGLALMMGCEKREDPVARGRYLVTVGGCNDCHTPSVPGPGGMPVPDTTLLLSGHPASLPYPSWTPEDMQQRNAIALCGPMLTAWAGPWGVSFTMNLTPDQETGIGEWTEEAFVSAMRTGKHQGQPNAREILPPMPWQNLKLMTDPDLKAMWAYLRTIPPVKNQVPLPVPPGTPPPPAQ